MSDLKRTVIAFLLGATSAAGIAWWIRPADPFDRLETFPRALADAVQDGDIGPLGDYLAPEFKLKGVPGMESLDRSQTAGVLQELVSRRIRPCVVYCEPEAAPDEDGRTKLTVYGVALEGNLQRTMRVTAYVVRRDGRWQIVEASLSRQG